jgi:translation initiation factor 1A
MASLEIIPKRGGKRAKKQKNHTIVNEAKELQIKDECQEYAIIDKVLGSDRYTARCFDHVVRMAHRRGNMKAKTHKTLIYLGDLVLISKRDYQDAKCDIILRYTPVQVSKLINMGELPSNLATSKASGRAITEEEENQPFDFNDI